MDEKKEPKYLDLSASCAISIEEMLQRFFMPSQEQKDGKSDEEEEKADD